MNKFTKIYTHRRPRQAKNRLGLLGTDEGGKRTADQDAEFMPGSSRPRRPKIRIYPVEKFGDAFAH